MNKAMMVNAALRDMVDGVKAQVLQRLPQYGPERAIYTRPFATTQEPLRKGRNLSANEATQMFSTLQQFRTNRTPEEMEQAIRRGPRAHILHTGQRGEEVLPTVHALVDPDFWAAEGRRIHALQGAGQPLGTAALRHPIDQRQYDQTHGFIPAGRVPATLKRDLSPFQTLQPLRATISGGAAKATVKQSFGKEESGRGFGPRGEPPRGTQYAPIGYPPRTPNYGYWYNPFKFPLLHPDRLGEYYGGTESRYGSGGRYRGRF